MDVCKSSSCINQCASPLWLKTEQEGFTLLILINHTAHHTLYIKNTGNDSCETVVVTGSRNLTETH